MDTFTIVITFILLWLLFQYQQNMLVIGVAILVVLSMRSWSALLLVLFVLGILIFFQNSLNTVFPLALLLILALGLLLGAKSEQQQPEFYPPDMGMGGLMG